jgi:hypothetical protein
MIEVLKQELASAGDPDEINHGGAGRKGAEGFLFAYASAAERPRTREAAHRMYSGRPESQSAARRQAYCRRCTVECPLSN